jgi:diguanylate cyclase (GGDEF)-like protein
MLFGDTTSLYEGDLRRLTRIIRAAISFFGVVLLAVIAFAGWAADKTATDRERTLLENAINQNIASVLVGLKSVAWWDDAVIKIGGDTVDFTFAETEFGLFLTETYGHDEVYILNERDEPIFAYKDGARADADAYKLRLGELSSLVAEVRHGDKASTLKKRPDEFGRTQEDYRYLSKAVEAAHWAGHIVSIDGKAAVVGAITIVPNIDLSLLKGTPKLLIGVNYFKADTISKIARSILLSDLRLTPDPVRASGVLSEPFMGDDDTLAGYLSWTTQRPGKVLLTIILPLVACAVFATGLLSNHMFRRLWRASSELAQREARSRHAARHDALSGLPNRQHMVDEVEARLATLGHAPRGTRAIAAYVDIDRFKDINDTLGHEAGDKLIQAVSKRLKARLRGDDFLARFGGDEFAVLCLSAEPSGDMLLAHRIASRPLSISRLRSTSSSFRSRPRSGSRWRPSTAARRTNCSAMPISRFTKARISAATVPSHSPPKWRSRSKPATRSRSIFGPRSSGRSFRFTISRSSRAEPGRSWGRRRCCAGRTRLAA